MLSSKSAGNAWWTYYYIFTCCWCADRLKHNYSSNVLARVSYRNLFTVTAVQNFDNVASCSSHKESFLIRRLHAFQCSLQVCSMCYASMWEVLFISLRAAHSISVRWRTKIFNATLRLITTTFPWHLRFCASICATGSSAVGSWLPSLGTSGSVRLFARQDQVPLVAGYLPLVPPVLCVYLRDRIKCRW